MNRKLISRLAALHFAATKKNISNLLREGIDSAKIFLTGNPVVDSLEFIQNNVEPGKEIAEIIRKTKDLKCILLTAHRRESFGEKMDKSLKDLTDFIENNKDVCLVFPVHPNPNVRKSASRILKNKERIYLLDPLGYVDFISLMKESWLIVSDSGGIQEESPSLGKPLLILRENTERPEVVESGIAKLVGNASLYQLLNEIYNDETWINSVKNIPNPFGDGKAAAKIVEVLINV